MTNYVDHSTAGIVLNNCLLKTGRNDPKLGWEDGSVLKSTCCSEEDSGLVPSTHMASGRTARS